MEELLALAVPFGEFLTELTYRAIVLAVAIASFRRSRCLSGYSIPQSLFISAVAGWFWFVWVIISLLDRKYIAREWRNYHANRLSSVV